MTENSTLDERLERCLLTLSEHFDKEDWSVRQRQLLIWRRLKLYWNSFSNIYFSEVAHDWRIWDKQEDLDQSYYDKPVNVFRAYLESIIAALSVTIPNIKCYPDDAQNPQDIETANAGDRIFSLISKHNKVDLLWLHGIFITATEGMVAAYNYTDTNEKYGTYEEDVTEEIESQVKICPVCHINVADPVFSNREKDEFDPGDDDVAVQNYLTAGEIICQNCGAMLDPELQTTPLIVTRIVDKTTKPKSRQCIEVYGGLNVKIPNYAVRQEDLPYLRFSYETHYAQAYEEFGHLKGKKFDDGPKKTGGSYGDPYEAWARLSPQYNGEYPMHNVTVNKYWFRPFAYNILNEDDIEFVKKKFPNGCKFTKVNDCPAEACNEELDDHWTIARNPLSDYLHYDPTGTLLVSIQDITNDIVSLVLQTIEHGIPQTFADPSVLNFEAYKQTETAPGLIYPATPRTGKTVGDGFYEVKTATLSGEILPFAQNIQSMGQLVSGALPSLFGGASSQGSQTASEYAMSRAQALQRLQNTWKMLGDWWKDIYGKVIPQFIKTMATDEKYVEKDENNNFINVFVRKAELEGKIGQIELESSDQLPQTWAQKRDVIMELIKLNNPEILQLLASPENLKLIKEATGINEFEMPGEADRQKQFEEIQMLINSEPTVIPPSVDPMMLEQMMASGQPVPPEMMQAAQPQELPSVEVDPILDNHALEAEICRSWLIGLAGRLAKTENPSGYKNVLLHFKAHQQVIQMQQMQQAAMTMGPQQNQPATEKPPSTPIQGESDAQRFTAS